MLSTLFGFSGRIGRLAYIGWSFALGLVAGLIAFVLAFAGLGVGIAAGADVKETVAPLTTFVAIAPALWGTCALVTKRLRDIGLAAVPVLAFMLFVVALELAVLKNMSGARFVPPLQDYTPVGGLLVLGFTLALLFWPGDAPESVRVPEAGEGAFERVPRAAYAHALPDPDRAPILVPRTIPPSPRAARRSGGAGPEAPGSPDWLQAGLGAPPGPDDHRRVRVAVALPPRVSE